MILNISKQKMFVIVSAIIVFFSFGILSVKADELTCENRLEYSEISTVNIHSNLKYILTNTNILNIDPDFIGPPPPDNLNQDNSEGSITCDNFKIITQPMWMLIRIATPIMLLVLGALDFAKATAASDEKMMKKSVQTFFKRTLIAVAIFLLPTIVNLIVGWTIYDNLTGCL